MENNQKPFACTIKGCEMTFTNEDHLNWHHKKHDMVLTLGVEKNGEVADQTPTPTRFIRNCEEVGLFQDLQNVNPFDETFKKAIECVKTGTLHVPEVQNDDNSLHTPHIFPPVEENAEKYTNNSNVLPTTQTTEFIIPVPDDDALDETVEDRSPQSLIIAETVNIIENCKDNNDENDNLRNKLKEVIRSKEKIKCVETINQIIITPAENSNKKRKIEINPIVIKDNKNKSKDIDVDKEKEKIREMNRVAQLRCRKRKQMLWKKMENELSILKSDNKKLTIENNQLKRKMAVLKQMLLSHRNCNITNDLTLEKIEEILNSQCLIDANKDKPPPMATNVKPIVPKPMETSDKNNPVLIKILTPPPKLALSVSVLP